MPEPHAMPGQFVVSRSTVIAAPPEAIFPYLNDFHRWIDWSPYEGRDAAMERTYDGPAQGVGAAYTWSGKKSGAGRMRIDQARTPSELVIDLEFTKPMKAHNTAVFTLKPGENGTETTWSMHGPLTLAGRIFGVFMNLDKMVGTDFEVGLANLKRRVETASA